MTVRHYILRDYLIGSIIKVGGFRIYGSLALTNGHKSRSDVLSLAEKYAKDSLAPPRNKVLFRSDDGTVLRVAYHHWDIGNFVISAKDPDLAYLCARALQGYFSLFVGYHPRLDIGTYFLKGVSKIPRRDWASDDLIKNLIDHDCNPKFEIFDLLSGTMLQPGQLDDLPNIVEKIYADQRLSLMLLHLNQSFHLFDGYMNSSYYGFHYSRERPEIDTAILHRRFLENRSQYELAFLSAFKAVESFFGSKQIKGQNVDSLFDVLPYRHIIGTDRYSRRHEIFSGFPEEIDYRSLILHFLDFRNVVAAHSNRAPPGRFKMTEDQIYEIQLFCRELFHRALESFGS